MSILLRPSCEWRKCSVCRVCSLHLYGGSNRLHRPHCMHSPMAKSSMQYRPWRQTLTSATMTTSKRVSSRTTEHGSQTKNSSTCHPDELLPKMTDYDELCRREKKCREKMAQDYRYDHRLKVVLGEQLFISRPCLHTRSAHRGLCSKMSWDAKVSCNRHV